jgi:hypothetical protein
MYKIECVLSFVLKKRPIIWERGEGENRYYIMKKKSFTIDKHSANDTYTRGKMFLEVGKTFFQKVVFKLKL